MLIDVEENRLIVISDLHLGNPYSLAARNLASFVDYVIDGGYSLCINGDGVDILQGRLGRLTQQGIEVMDLLRRFEASDGRMYYVVGNHDMVLERAPAHLDVGVPHTFPQCPNAKPARADRTRPHVRRLLRREPADLRDSRHGGDTVSSSVSGHLPTVVRDSAGADTCRAEDRRDVRRVLDRGAGSRGDDRQPRIRRRGVRTHASGRESRASSRRHVSQLRQLVARHDVRSDRRRLGLTPRVARVGTSPSQRPVSLKCLCAW